MVCLLFAQSSIDRPTYVNKYRIKGAFLTKPLPKRTARNLSTPICINGYLWVYPIDLGYFTSHPNEVISQINQQNKYGRDNWRIPTSEELMTMEDNASTIGLGDDVYMCTAHSNGVLRLVAKGETKKAQREAIISSGKGKQVGNVIWRTEVYRDKGEDIFKPSAASSLSFPKGWRLPKINEIDALLRFNNNDVGKTWSFLKEITSYNMKVNDYYYSRTGGSPCYANKGFIIYRDTDGTNAAAFHLGTGRSNPYVTYGDDTWGFGGGYIILVFDEKLL